MSSLEEESVKETVTFCPEVTAEVRVSSTVEPDVATLEMEAADSSTVTLRSDVVAVVDERISL